MLYADLVVGIIYVAKFSNHLRAQLSDIRPLIQHCLVTTCAAPSKERKAPELPA
jgi:hypothetical protein